MGSAIVLGWIGFVGCGIGMISGGVLASMFRGAKRKYIPLIFSLCSGLIFGIVLLDIIPESVETGGTFATGVGLLAGAFLFRYIHKINHMISINTNNRYISTGIIMAVSIAIHNFPSGVALGASTKGLTPAMMSTMIFHTIPEGVAVFTPLFAARFPVKVILPITALVALPVGLGAMLGSVTGLTTPFLLAFIICLSMGIVLIVTMKEILGDALQKAHIIICLGMLSLGFALIWLI